MINTHSSEETEAAGAHFAASLRGNETIAFFGDLGAGKTTFLKGLISALTGCSPSEITSPTFNYLNIYEGRGSCKTTVPQKIDDFDASFQGQLAGLCRADETMPEWAGKEARRKMASKGRFYGAHEFCNCLGKITVYHFDLYRLKAAEQFEGAGFSEYLNAEGICCLEWAEKIETKLPAGTIRITLEHQGLDNRLIKIDR